MKHLITYLLLLTATIAPSAAATLGQQADSAYNAEDYRQAIELYQRSIATEGMSSTAYYNLGNAYYRNDNPGRAVLSYERALRLDPTNADARQNLEFVRSRIQDRPEDDTPFFVSLHRGIRDSFTANTWAWIAFVTFLILAGAVALYIFASSVPLRKTGFFAAIVLVVIFIYFICVAVDSMDTARSHTGAVVVAPSTQLSSVPRQSRTSADKVVTIHEGTRVEIVDSVSTPDDPVSPVWYEVKINNSARAWLRASDVEKI